MELRDKYLYQGHHNRMVLLKDKIKSIVYCARTLLIEEGVAQICYRESISTIVYIPNRVQLKKVTTKTPYKLDA